MLPDAVCSAVSFPVGHVGHLLLLKDLLLAPLDSSALEEIPAAGNAVAAVNHGVHHTVAHREDEQHVLHMLVHAHERIRVYEVPEKNEYKT